MGRPSTLKMKCAAAPVLSVKKMDSKSPSPLCRIKLGYQLCYLYAALCPFTGHLLALILPDMSKASFCIFSKYLSEQVKRRYGKAPMLMIADGAGAHQKEVCLNYGIALQRLPTACPELKVRWNASLRNCEKK